MSSIKLLRSIIASMPDITTITRNIEDFRVKDTVVDVRIEVESFDAEQANTVATKCGCYFK